MKSTQKFLCYSLALVGAALMFSVGCKKADNVTNTTVVASQKPVFNTGGISVSIGGASNTAVVTETIAYIGSSSVTAVGFNFTATGAVSGSVTPTSYAGSVTATVPTGTLGVGSFSATLLTAAAATALSGSTIITWYVSSYATNGTGTTYSALTYTITTTN